MVDVVVFAGIWLWLIVLRRWAFDVLLIGPSSTKELFFLGTPLRLNGALLKVDLLDLRQVNKELKRRHA